jgi:F-type H+-transporting ATPase subunit delta
MALTRSTARRYAEAAFEIAERDGTLSDWLAALDASEARLSSPEVLRALGSPALPAERREALLDRLLERSVEGAPRSLLALLVRRGRIEQLPAVTTEFRRLYRRREGIVEAEVTSAVPLADATLASLQERLSAGTGRRVELTQRTDAELLGGLQVRVGDRLIDGSVRGRLERLRSRLTQSTT